MVQRGRQLKQGESRVTAWERYLKVSPACLLSFLELFSKRKENQRLDFICWKWGKKKSSKIKLVFPSSEIILHCTQSSAFFWVYTDCLNCVGTVFSSILLSIQSQSILIKLETKYVVKREKKKSPFFHPIKKHARHRFWSHVNLI